MHHRVVVVVVVVVSVHVIKHTVCHYWWVDEGICGPFALMSGKLLLLLLLLLLSLFYRIPKYSKLKGSAGLATY